MIDVLIVEDDPMVAELNKKYLQMIPGFKFVGQAHNGEEALKVISQKQISLILLDLFMPNINGLELLKQIRNDYPAIDIIMVTAARNTDSIQTALRLGVIDYIVKPFTFERLRTALFTYQERLRLLSSHAEFDQSELDQGIFSKPAEQNNKLPKGIDAETLDRVKAVIIDYGTAFTVADLVPLIELSRISLKKYIDYLDVSGELQSHLVYSAVGRPARMYLWQNKV
ncbi:response regulator [Utexia brackfieldae]|uniref:response regulator n=1 Tax=Utexia brackfieldae TaxID=3074108 RepID=UPI00370D7CFF